MPFVIIENILIDVKSCYSAGQALTETEANVLSSILLKQLLTELKKYIAANPDATLQQIQAEAKRIEATMKLTPTNTQHDPIKTEAVAICKEKIIAKLAAENLPPPVNIDIHAEELARGNSSIIAVAKLRIEARLQAGLQMIAEERK